MRALARFEDALLQIRSGSAATFEVVWDRHPDHVFVALDSGSELSAPENDRQYRMLLAAELPQMVSCTREQIIRN